MNSYLFIIFVDFMLTAGSYTVFGQELPNKNQSTITSNKCQEKSCIVKCCGIDEMLLKIPLKPLLVCTNREQPLNLSGFTIFDENLDQTGKQVSEVFEILDGREENVNLSLFNPVNRKNHKLYLVEDGRLVIETPNMEPRIRWMYYGRNQFCVDHLSYKTRISRQIFIKTMMQPKESPPNLFLTALMLLSCLFLAIVLIVYGVLEQLRNLRGLVLMSYVFSLFSSFMVFGIFNIFMVLKKHNQIVCKSFSFMFYFWLLSSFFWMNIMSFDIWWTFRGFVKLRPIHRRGEWCKYLIYCSYAWGVPLLMTGALVAVNEIDMRSTPWFITPQIAATNCFIKDFPRLLYLHIPMLVILVSNLVLFMLTVVNMRRLTRDNEMLNAQSGAHLSQRNRFIVYMKLSAVMGINWILEVTSTINAEQKLWMIVDVYNLAMGVIIFFIFICKKKIWRMLLKKWQSRQGLTTNRYLRGSSTQAELDSEVSQSALPLNGVSYKSRSPSRDELRFKSS